MEVDKTQLFNDIHVILLLLSNEHQVAVAVIYSCSYINDLFDRLNNLFMLQ